MQTALMYALKPYTLMQWDFARREIIRKLQARGQRAEGLRNLSRYIAWFVMLGMGKELIAALLKGEDVSPERIPDHVGSTLLQAAGLNRFVASKLVERPVMATLENILPPLGFADALWKDVSGQSEKGSQAVRHTPLAGDLLYFWTPLGRGWSLAKDDAKREYRGKLRDLRREAYLARVGGDLDAARDLVHVYNDLRKEGPGDGRKRPLTLTDLTSLPMTADEREDAREIREDAMEAVGEGDTAEANELLAKFNTGRRKQTSIADLYREYQAQEK